MSRLCDRVTRRASPGLDTDLSGLGLGFIYPGNARQETGIIYSDIRHKTPDIDLESPSKLLLFSRARTRSKIAVADLKAVHMHLLGVDRGERNIAYCQGLRDWPSDSMKAGVALAVCFLFRELHAD